ncbi:hypothetical protein IAG25_23110 [Caballeronia sp. EK]|uniref:XAC2610-related protein n=1 Tax=Caballeronia sp. EK TaxID=2767469 RepID=UPI001654E8F1|nr:hypothetical protein [Caballeronia sp. EK]MBC8639727.1 hypothetical protein [Caballeronia sp. EK]
MKTMVMFIVALCFSDFAVSGPQVPVTGVVQNSIHVTTPSGKLQIIAVNHEVTRSDIKFEDFNFDGVTDLKVLRDRGANQEFYDVYLYSKRSGLYQFNEEMSDLPCIEADAKRKEVIGACFHESACENWEEHYSITSKGKLSLVGKTGTYCVPTGEAYAYTERYKNGKRISSQVREIKWRSE